MRNLKKVLSLALALVMLLGMMVVGAGAVDTGFEDNASIKDSFKTAAAVNKALGLMTGDGTNLNPTTNITRAEAFILSLRVKGDNTDAIAKKWPVSEKPFNDVSTGKWYAPYMAYGKEMELIAGSNGNYKPDEDITVVEYSILLLKQLGFDGSRYIGASWNTNAAADAQDAGLYDDLGNVNYYSHKLTREEACQMVFNALFYSPSGSNGYILDGDDSIIYPDTMSAALAILGGLGTNMSAAPASDTLAKKVYKLSSRQDVNELGLPITVWSVADEDVCSTEAASSAVKSYTSQQDAEDIIKDLKGYSILDNNTTPNKVLINANGAFTPGDTELVVSNGVKGTLTVTTTAAQAIADLTGDGTIVEVFATGKTITKIVQIIKTPAKLLAAPIEKDGKVTITTLGISGRDAANVHGWEGLEKDDVVLFVDVENDDGEWVAYIDRPEVVTGVTTGYKANAGALINGKYYAATGLGTGVASGITPKGGFNTFYTEATHKTDIIEYYYYLDDGGFIFHTEKVDKSGVAQNYAVVLDTAWVLGSPTGDMNDDTSSRLQALILKLDGTTEVVTVKDVTLTYATGKTTKIAPVAAGTLLTSLGFAAGTGNNFKSDAAMGTAITAATGALNTGANVAAASAIEKDKFTAISAGGGTALFDGSTVAATPAVTALVTNLYVGVENKAGAKAMAAYITPGNFYSYSVDKNGRYSLSINAVAGSGDTYGSLADDTDGIKSRPIFNNGSTGNNNTVFLYKTTVDGDPVYTPYTGISNIPEVLQASVLNNVSSSTTSTRTVVKGADTIAKYVYVDAGAVVTSTVDIVYITDSRGTAVNGAGGVEYYLYSAVFNGKEMEIKVDEATGKDATGGVIKTNGTTFYRVTAVDGDIYTLATVSAANGTTGDGGLGTGVMVNDGELIGTKGNGTLDAFTYKPDAPAYYIDLAGNSTETTVAALNLDATDLVYVVGSSRKASVVYVAERGWMPGNLTVVPDGTNATVDTGNGEDNLRVTNPVLLTQAKATGSTVKVTAPAVPNMKYTLTIRGFDPSSSNNPKVETQTWNTALSGVNYTLHANDEGKTLVVTLEGEDYCSGAKFVETFKISVPDFSA